MPKLRKHKAYQVGEHIKRLELLSITDRIRGNDKWLCRCDCGRLVTVWSNNLRSGRSGSCGCLRRDVSKISQTLLLRRHGESGTFATPEYISWSAMMRRCYSPNAGNRRYYSELGVTVCSRWHRYENFLADMGRKPTAKHSIDRYPNPAGNYEPSNCRWATASEQARNKRIKSTIANDTINRV